MGNLSGVNKLLSLANTVQHAIIDKIDRATAHIMQVRVGEESDCVRVSLRILTLLRRVKVGNNYSIYLI